jgi:hypothetical protein
MAINWTVLPDFGAPPVQRIDGPRVFALLAAPAAGVAIDYSYSTSTNCISCPEMRERPAGRAGPQWRSNDEQGEAPFEFKLDKPSQVNDERMKETVDEHSTSFSTGVSCTSQRTRG